MVLIRGRSLTLFTDLRYLEAAKKNSYRGVAVRDGGELAKSMRGIRRCGIESQDVTLQRLKRWKTQFKNTKFVQTNGLVEAFRRQKSPEELERFRRAQRITRTLLSRVPKALRPGITERMLALRLHEWALELGADGMAFDPIVAFGPHTSRPHHHPTTRKLRNRDIVQIDVGVRYNGYCADQSTVFFKGTPTEQQQKAYDAVAAAKKAATAAVHDGVTNHELDRIARQVLKQAGMEKAFTHALGHGLGLEVHEGVILSQKAPKQKLLSNEIVTIEPGVYFPGKFGIRLEEEVLVG